MLDMVIVLMKVSLDHRDIYFLHRWLIVVNQWLTELSVCTFFGQPID